MLNAFFVIIGAGLWATDTIFRLPLAQQFSPLTIVYLEHIIATLVTFVWVILFQRKKIFLRPAQMFGAAFVGVCGSAVATVLFTTSFQLINPSVAILLQKFQPILVLILSWMFLGEKLSLRFWGWSFLAILAAYFLSFPHFFHLGNLAEADRNGVVLALAAAFFWAVSTITGKVVLKEAPSSVLSFWRFFFGLAALFLITRLSPQTEIELPFLYLDHHLLKSVIYMATISGFLGVTIYYQGLAKIPASVASILELSFPLCALYINSRYLGVHLLWGQLAAAGILLVAMVGVARARK
jgi:drug/metabolite transporter (DMT)-like permease